MRTALYGTGLRAAAMSAAAMVARARSGPTLPR